MISIGNGWKSDKEQLSKIQKKVNQAIQIQKHIYKQKSESGFKEDNEKKVWDGMRLMSGY